MITSKHDAPRWIPVEERLPENEQDVLICAKRKYHNKDEYRWIIAKAFYTDGKHDTEHSNYVWVEAWETMEYSVENDAFLIPESWWESVDYSESFCRIDDFVTYWMPLPEAPKEAE